MKRRSRSQMFFKIDVLKNFAIFGGILESLFNKVADLQDNNFLRIGFL